MLGCREGLLTTVGSSQMQHAYSSKLISATLDMCMYILTGMNKVTVQVRSGSGFN